MSSPCIQLAEIGQNIDAFCPVNVNTCAERVGE